MTSFFPSHHLIFFIWFDNKLCNVCFLYLFHIVVYEANINNNFFLDVGRSGFCGENEMSFDYKNACVSDLHQSGMCSATKAGYSTMS